MTEQISIAVIGGSGLYSMPEITDKVAYAISTPYGSPSSEVVVGNLRGKRVAFLPRHGIGHVYTPSTVPYRANIYALKTLGVRFILAVNACGSLREDYAPGDLVIPHQLYDHTKLDRGRTFFETGLVAHISVADPLAPELCEQVYKAAQQVPDAVVHQGGTFIIIEGPRFSTRGESEIYRQWGCSLIGMTTCPEAFLAREAEIAYMTMAHVTDYDVWHVSEEPVTAEMVIRTFNHNIEIVQRVLAAAIETLDEKALYAAHRALDGALVTAPDKISAEMRARLQPIVGRVLA
ncbi:MAG: S-methyl-5'-thioadenosine phosphorylase [Chloroflexi bacterium]|nr:S-methyl-5'-thioadenosine phosphorylase [Chloroflexota bacterium]